jgi:hypothetical protein
MPPYKLHIRSELDNPQKYKKLLLDGMEVVRGVRLGCELYITNRGEEKFPGGTIKYFRIRYKEHLNNRSDFFGQQVSMLNQNESTKLFSVNFIPSEEGWFWLELAIESNDKQPIEYYQTKNASEEPDKIHWIDGYLSLNRENLDILLALRKPSQESKGEKRKLKKRGKK